MERKESSFETSLIHAGERKPGIEGAVCLPIFQSSTYEYTGQNDERGVRYIRYNNTPNHHALHLKLATLEGTEASVVTGSGMAAISSLFFGLLQSGDHILVLDTVYGGTHGLLTQLLSRFGVTYSSFDGNQPDSWASLLQKNTRMIYSESITNPLLDIPDHQAITHFAKQHGLLSAIDNTFATPLNFRPVDWGYDLIVHSTSKYLNGHSDVVGGVLMGSQEHIATLNKTLHFLGGTMDPHACFLLQRGMKTLAVRVRYQNESAQKIAAFLETHAGIQSVCYPGLPSHSDHEHARRYLKGFGGMLAFELKDSDKVDAFLSALDIPYIAPSLGGPETLLTCPALTSHAGLTADERHSMGISDGLIRVSVGLEHTDELIDDLAQALK